MPRCSCTWACEPRAEIQVPGPGGFGGRGDPVRALEEDVEGEAEGLVRRARRDRSRAFRKRRPRACTGSTRCKRRAPSLACHQRERQRHQVEVRQPLRLPRIARGWHPSRHRRDDGRQGGDGCRLRRRRQGLGRFPARRPAAACWCPRSIRFAHCRRRWRATRSRPWRMPRRAPTFSSPPPATRT